MATLFWLAKSHHQAIWTYCFDQTVIINEILARYGIPYGCTMVILIKRILKTKSFGKFDFKICFTSITIVQLWEPVTSKHFIYNHCLVKAISSNDPKMTHYESKHVAIWNLSLYIYIYSCDRLTFPLYCI
jgi:hypothetical protein